MIPVMCIVQDEQISALIEKNLRSQISAFVDRAFKVPADID